MRISRRRFGLSATAALPLFQATPQAAASTTLPSAVQRAVRPADVSEPAGFLGERMLANSRYLAGFDIASFLAMFERKNYRDWFWIGEQPGKWLEASVYAAATCRHSGLEEKAHSALARLAAAQDRDGYLGVTDPAVRTPRHPMRGMDPYEAYYTLHGLLTAAQEWNSAPARRAAIGFGDFFLANVHAGGPEFWALPKAITIAGHEVHFGLEGSLLIDPVMRLYQLTGDKRYLDWCRWVVAQIDKWTVVETYSNLGKVADGKMALNEVQPKVHAHTLHMNSLGFLRLYEVTGDPQLLRIVRAAWASIMENQRYISGGVSVGESYREPHMLFNTGQGVETCAIMSWLLLNQQLLELTGDPAHADAMEQAIWNHMPASQTWDADGYRYFAPLNGWKPVGYFTGPNCCSSSGPRMFAMLPGFCYGAGAGALFVNQYAASKLTARVNGQTCALRVSGDYPSGAEAAVEIVELASPQAFTLNLRIPAWCANPRMAVNGQPQEVRPGVMTALKREWKRGDRVELQFPAEPKWVAGSYSNQGLSALTRGPLAYALDTVWTQPGGFSHPGDMPQVRTYMKDGSKASEANPFAAVSREIRPAPTPTGALGPAYTTNVTLWDGKRTDALMLPFANVGRWYNSETEKRQLLAERAAAPPDAAATESAGYRQGGELKPQKYPYAVWIKTVG